MKFLYLLQWILLNLFDWFLNCAISIDYDVGWLPEGTFLEKCSCMMNKYWNGFYNGYCSSENVLQDDRSAVDIEQADR